MSAVILPTIHLNGTSLTELLRQIGHALEACRAAKKALEEAAPHGRDYYPQGMDAYPKALHAHGARVVHLSRVITDLETIAEGIITGKGAA